MKLYIANFTNYVEFDENLHIVVLDNQLYYQDNSNYSKPCKITLLTRNALIIFQR
jgi:hypothetical protein